MLSFLSRLTLSSKLVERRSVFLLLSVLAISAVALSVWQSVSYYVSQKAQSVLIQNAMHDSLSSLNERSSGKLAGNAISLHVIARSPTLEQFVSTGGENLKELRVLLTAIIESSPRAYQIRFIDAKGYEKIRLDKNDGMLKFTPKSNLQYKGNRSYFTELLNTKPGRIYVSTLDLNIEHGKIQEPWKPTIRLGSAVFNKNDQFTGVLLINLDAREILEIYENVDLKMPEEYSMINADGYWIYGRSKNKLWGFMFGQIEQSVKHEIPTLWERIISDESTKFSQHSITWSFRSTKVSDLFPDSLTYDDNDRILWYGLVKSAPEPLVASITGYIPSLVILVSLAAFGWAWISNVKHLRRAEKELIKSEKLSSLGGLVAGVAHELNTPIGSSVTIASTIKDQAQDMYRNMEQGKLSKSAIVEFVDSTQKGSGMILRGLNRAVELIGHFKQIAVDQSGEQRRVFELDGYIKEMQTTFQHLFKHRSVSLSLQLSANVVLDTFPGALSQVIINLVQNSLIHGFNEYEQGEIILSTDRINQDKVKIEVIDNGKGMPEAVMDRVFEPFFTTKLGQGGSGLGLHIVHNIVSDILIGKLSVTSDMNNRVTRFTITIPCNSQLKLRQTSDRSCDEQRTAA